MKGKIIWLTPAQLLAKIDGGAAYQRIPQPPLCKQLLYQHTILDNPANESSTYPFDRLRWAEVFLLLDGLVHEVEISEGLQLTLRGGKKCQSASRKTVFNLAFT